MTVNSKIDLKDLSPDRLTAFLAEIGRETYRAGQILKWIYQRGVTDFNAMTDLAKSLRTELIHKAYISYLTPAKEEISVDGTRKFLFELEDGKCVESVIIPMDSSRNTLCVSTQVGCAMRCSFCLTGAFGLDRNLKTAEIINQVCAVREDFAVDNIVLMGMGEPLHNLDNVISALEILYAQKGLNYSHRKVTLSTSGLIPEMQKLGRKIKVNLAVSLNATTDDVRDQIMPINKKYPLAQLMQACRNFPLLPRQRITFEYILIKGLNDSLEDAKRLVKLLHGIKAKVNLIPFNQHSGSVFERPTEEAMIGFQTYLLQKKIVAVRRASKGQDISAACGQLKGSLKGSRGN